MATAFNNKQLVLELSFWEQDWEKKMDLEIILTLSCIFNLCKNQERHCLETQTDSRDR